MSSENNDNKLETNMQYVHMNIVIDMHNCTKHSLLFLWCRLCMGLCSWCVCMIVCMVCVCVYVFYSFKTHYDLFSVLRIKHGLYNFP